MQTCNFLFSPSDEGDAATRQGERNFFGLQAAKAQAERPCRLCAPAFVLCPRREQILRIPNPFVRCADISPVRGITPALHGSYRFYFLLCSRGNV